MKVGITGQSGFMGAHLFNFLGLQKDVQRIAFKDEYFQSEMSLCNFVRQCDVIVHFAALNRHNDPDVLFETNIWLVEQLINAMKTEQVTPHILFSSSIQESRDNPYGKSKKMGREKFSDWAEKSNAKFTGLVLPNVFGPFGHPYYNSVVSTFSHQLTHNEKPKIQIDGSLKLIYVGELMWEIWDIIKNGLNEPSLFLNHTSEKKVSELLNYLEYYKSTYFENGIIPKLETQFELNLFNTFRSYIDQQNHFPYKLKLHNDERGSFVETLKAEMGGQHSFSTTKPGICRGDHYHTRKIERFAVIKGKALIHMRKIGTEEVLKFELEGNRPAFVDIPIWYTHNITNIGNEELYTVFWINEFYDPQDPDTYFEKV